jgi:hypothetical protein
MASEISGRRSKKPTTSTRRGANGLGRTQTRIAGKFRSEYTKARLYELVRKAALFVKPIFPKDLRQTEFDSARSEIGHADAPTARQIATRLARSWADIVRDAVDQKTNQVRHDKVETKNEIADWVTRDHIFYALRRVRSHLGGASLTRDQYEAGRIELLAADREHHRFGGVLEENLPTLNQVETFARNLLKRADLSDWEAALLIAEIKTPEPGKVSAIEMHVAVYYYIKASGGLLPSTTRELERFRQIAHIAVKRRPKNKSFEEVRHDGVAYAATLGVQTTGELSPSGSEPEFDLTKLDIASLPVEKKRLTKGEKFEKLAEYLDYCEKHDTEPRNNHYKGLAPKMGWPSAANLGEDMTWGGWIKGADERRREKRKSEAASGESEKEAA